MKILHEHPKLPLQKAPEVQLPDIFLKPMPSFARIAVSQWSEKQDAGFVCIADGAPVREKSLKQLFTFEPTELER